MKRIAFHRSFLLALLTLALLAGCSRDPNVRKQKYLESGNRYFQKQDYRAAAIQFENAIQVDPKYAAAHYQLAQSFLHLADWRGGYLELTRTIDLAPENLKAQTDLGNLLLGARQFDQAQQRADLVLQKDPNNVDAHILRATALAKLQETDASLKEMQAAIELNPERAPSYLDMAFLQISAKQATAAEESFKKAVSLEPKSVLARLALGTFYSQQKRWPDAETQFRQAVEIEPKNIGPRIALCNLFLAQKETSQAEEVAKETKDALKDSPNGYRLLGDLYYQLGDLPKAVDEYASLYKQHPKDLRVKKNYIDLLVLQGRLEEAATLNDQILKANPKDQGSVIVRDQILIKRGHAAEALDQLRTAIKNEPDNALAHYYLGLAFNATGDSGQAETEWRQTARLNPKFVEAQSALAAVALRKGDPEDLTNAAEAIISARPSAPDGYVLRAVAKSSKHDQTGAETDLNRAMEVDPHNPSGFTAMAQLRTSQKRYADAERLYGQALTIDSNATTALQGLVALLVSEKQADKAMAEVTEMITKAPENSGYYMLEANLLLSRKPPEFDKAEAALLKASDLNKSDAAPLLILAQLYTARGAADKAEASSQEALQHNPKNAQLSFLVGAIEDGQGHWQKAQDLYQKALQFQPDLALASNNLAYSMLEHGGNSDVALTLAQTARQKLPDNPSVADTLAWAYYKKGTYTSAINLLEDAIKKAPDDPSFHYHLGLAYQKIEEKSKAKAHLERTLQLNPAFEHAADVRTVLAELKT
jgi:Tfp pilus assembly protein PilF